MTFLLKDIRAFGKVDDVLDVTEGKTGDGVGIMLQISHKFFSKIGRDLQLDLGEERDKKQTDTDHGRGHPERRQIHIYQFICKKGRREDRKQAGSDQRQAVDKTRKGSGASRYPRDLMA